MPLNLILLAVLAVLIQGCMPSTVRDLKSSGIISHEHVSVDYQEAYRRVAAGAECEYGSGSPLLNPMRVNAQLYPNLNYGEVTVTTHPAGWKSSTVIYVVAKPAAGGADVTVTAADRAGYRSAGTSVLDWAAGRARRCSADQ